MATFSIWEGDLCGIALVPGPGPPAFADGNPQDPGAVKVAEFEAADWNAACQVLHDRYGWGQYELSEGWNPLI